MSPDAAPLARGDAARAFREPWEAQAFALTVTLCERGLFTWPEWARALGAEIAAAGAQAGGENYYRDWLAALETLVVARGLASAELLAASRDAWDRAAHATPHGAPIRLDRRER